jgi:predicted nucleotide-binding protein (sugar kinase/HSP70/actin superfamily)
MTKGLDSQYVTPPPITKKTLELGSKHSPDYVCAPFKIHLGCYIEAIEKGANALVQLGGACRLGYYGELHEQIIKDLGYDVDFINLAKGDYSKPQTFYAEFKKINPEMSLTKATSALLTSLKMVECMDTVDDFVRRNIGFEIIKGSFEDMYADYLAALKHVESRKELEYLTSNYMKRFKAIPVKTPKNPLKVGIVGEYYSIMEPFSNHNMERELAGMGMVIERWMNISNSLFHFQEKEMLTKIRGYSKYNMGATSMSTIERALQFAKKGYDGIIHLKSFGCTPEMDAMPVLQNISADYKIPVLYFSFDSQTSDEGVKTRLEAFYDMIKMRKEAGR